MSKLPMHDITPDTLFDAVKSLSHGGRNELLSYIGVPGTTG